MAGHPRRPGLTRPRLLPPPPRPFKPRPLILQLPARLPMPVPTPSATTPDVLMSAAERDALSLSDLAAEADAATEQDAAEAADRAAEDRLAPAIKLLELINAPVSFIPDAFRDAAR